MAGKIFINYRRSQNSEFALLLHNALQQAFEPDQLFTDVASIAVGQNFAQQLKQLIAQCDVLLVIIGENWTDVREFVGRSASRRRGGFCAR